MSGTSGCAPSASARRRTGVTLTAAAALCWGIGGVIAQYLFQRQGVDPGWLVCVRMTVGGLLLLVVFRPAWPGREIGRLLVVAVFGIAATQYTWFAAIDYSNVAAATFIQYSGVAMTAGWQLLRRQISPTPGRAAALLAAVAGVSLLALGQSGGLDALRVNPLGAGLALVSAVAFSYYLLGSARLVEDLDVRSLTAWGLTVAGLALVPWTRPWEVRLTGDPLVGIVLVAVVAVVCTALAFSLSFSGLRRLTATESAVTSTLEPAFAGLIGALFLGVLLTPLQYLGGALTLGAVLLLTVSKRAGPGAPGTGGPVTADAGRETDRAGPAEPPER